MSRRTNGASLAAIRKMAGIRQGALAAAAGITGAYLSMIETKGRQPEPEVAARIAAELGVPLDAITYPVTETAEAVAP